MGLLQEGGSSKALVSGQEISTERALIYVCRECLQEFPRAKRIPRHRTAPGSLETCPVSGEYPEAREDAEISIKPAKPSIKLEKPAIKLK